MRRIILVFLLVLAAGVAARADSRYLVTQSTPSDCGPAALATLLRFYLGVPATEAEMVRLSNSRPGAGTSLLGLEKAATAKGCAADSFRMTFDTMRAQLAAFPTPLLVRTLNPEPHFAVVLYADDKYIFLGDPAAGNIFLRKAEFLKRWQVPGTTEGYVFVAAAPDPATSSSASSSTSVQQSKTEAASGLRVNDGAANRARVVEGLARQLRNLETTRPPLPMLRR